MNLNPLVALGFSLTLFVKIKRVVVPTSASASWIAAHPAGAHGHVIATAGGALVEVFKEMRVVASVPVSQNDFLSTVIESLTMVAT